MKSNNKQLCLVVFRREEPGTCVTLCAAHEHDWDRSFRTRKGVRELMESHLYLPTIQHPSVSSEEAAALVRLAPR